MNEPNRHEDAVTTATELGRNALASYATCDGEGVRLSPEQAAQTVAVELMTRGMLANPDPSGPPALSDLQKEDLGDILREILNGYPVDEDSKAHILADLDSAVDGWTYGAFTIPRLRETGGQ